MNEAARLRLRASGIHLLLSLAVIGLIVCLLLLRWYPPPLFISNGGWRALLIMTMVTLASGPLLTLVIFNPVKARHLIVFDLACIVIIQISSLVFGLHTVYSSRPVVLAYWNGMVYPVTIAELGLQDVRPDKIRTLSDTRPPLVYVRKPRDRQEVAAMLRYWFNHHLSEPSLAFLYEPFKERIDSVFAASVENRDQPRPAWLQARTDYMQNLQPRKLLAFIPYAGRYDQRLLVFNEQGRVIDALPLPLSTGLGH